MNHAARKVQAYKKDIAAKQKEEMLKAMRGRERAKEWAARPMQDEVRKEDLINMLRNRENWKFSFPALCLSVDLVGRDQAYTRLVVESLDHFTRLSMDLRVNLEAIEGLMEVVRRLAKYPNISHEMREAGMVERLVGCLEVAEEKLGWAILEALCHIYSALGVQDAADLRQAAELSLRILAGFERFQLSQDLKKPRILATSLWWVTRPFWAYDIRVEAMRNTMMELLEEANQRTLFYVCSFKNEVLLKMLLRERGDLVDKIWRLLESEEGQARRRALLFVESETLLPAKFVPIFALRESKAIIECVKKAKDFRDRLTAINIISNLLLKDKLTKEGMVHILKHLSVFYVVTDYNDKMLEDVTDMLLQQVGVLRESVLEEGLLREIKEYFEPDSLLRRKFQ